MKNKIKHFIVDLDELQDEYAYDSEEYNEIKKIKCLLDNLVYKLENTN